MSTTNHHRPGGHWCKATGVRKRNQKRADFEAMGGA